jgi:hypothetical protein
MAVPIVAESVAGSLRCTSCNGVTLCGRLRPPIRACHGYPTLNHFNTYLAELVETLERGSAPGAFWAKWIDVVVERTPPGAEEPTKS